MTRLWAELSRVEHKKIEIFNWPFHRWCFEIVASRAVSDCNRLSCKAFNSWIKFKFIHKISVIQETFPVCFYLHRGPDITRSGRGLCTSVIQYTTSVSCSVHAQSVDLTQRLNAIICCQLLWLMVIIIVIIIITIIIIIITQQFIWGLNAAMPLTGGIGLILTIIIIITKITQQFIWGLNAAMPLTGGISHSKQIKFVT